jgi:HSP20 family protein
MSQLIPRRFFEDPFKYIFEQNIAPEKLESALGSKYAFNPACDIKEDEEKISVHVDLPGVDKKDMHVEVKDHMLRISAERRVDNDDKKFLMKERFYGKYERAFRLPDNIDEENVQAKFNNGVLDVILNKKILSNSRSVSIED